MLRRLQTLASESKMQNQHSAAVFSGGKIYSVGINTPDCHMHGNIRGPSTHAEEAALRRVRVPQRWEKPQWVL